MISQDKMSDFEEVCMILHSFRIILYAQLASCLYPLYFFSEKKMNIVNERQYGKWYEDNGSICTNPIGYHFENMLSTLIVQKGA